MKKGDLVKIANEKMQKALSIDKEARGIVLKISSEIADILFFNPKIVGEYIIKEVVLCDLSLEN